MKDKEDLNLGDSLVADGKPSAGPAPAGSYLQNKQYADSAKLAARANLHRKYGRGGGIGWFDWIGQQARIPSGARVLDIGCGNGWLWEEGRASLPADIELTLADLSQGMVDDAMRRVVALGHYRAVTGLQANADALPFADASFDVVLACHMLYHVPAPAEALAEFLRVLRPGGILAVTTNKEGNMAPFYELGVQAFDGPAADPGASIFGLHRAETAIAAAGFAEVALLELPAELAVTDVDDLIAALTSFPPGEDASVDQLDKLRRLTEERMQQGGGVIIIPKTQGMVRAIKPA